MKRFALAIALTCIFAGSALAGDIPMVPGPPPPAPASAATDGDIGAGGFAEGITDEVVLAIFGFFAA